MCLFRCLLLAYWFFYKTGYGLPSWHPLSCRWKDKIVFWFDNNLSLNTPFLSHFIHPPLSPTLYNRLHIYILPLLPLFPSKKKNSFFDVIFYYEKTSFFFFFSNLVSNTVGTNKEILLKLLNHYLWKQSSITYFLYWIGWALL